MADIVARTGRHQQRYEDGDRLVAGCIPYRYTGADDTCNGNTGQRIEVLMITSPSGGLLFPKGGWETDETAEQAACREALEEAGVRGDIMGKLGLWRFKSKSSDVVSQEAHCKAVMFAMCVTEELKSWPEQNARQRQWLAITDADKQCRYEWMRDALKVCVDALKVCVSTYDVPPPSNSDVSVSSKS